VVSVADAPLSVKGTTTQVPHKSTGTVTVASFTDLGGPETADTYQAVIDWGDGSTTTAGTVVANSDGSFSVIGSHTYGKKGSYTLQVTITHEQSVTAVASSTLLVNIHDGPTVAAVLQTAAPRDAFLFVYYADTQRDGHQLFIDWGDGHHQSICVGNHRHGFALEFHHYGNHAPDKVTISVRVIDEDGTSSDPVTFTIKLKGEQ
jgi:hypothetical protein